MVVVVVFQLFLYLFCSALCKLLLSRGPAPKASALAKEKGRSDVGNGGAQIHTRCLGDGRGEGCTKQKQCLGDGAGDAKYKKMPRRVVFDK